MVFRMKIILSQSQYSDFCPLKKKADSEGLSVLPKDKLTRMSTIVSNQYKKQEFVVDEFSELIYFHEQSIPP